MILLDKWEELEKDDSLDQATVKLCKELAFSMFRKIFDTIGLNITQPDEFTVVASGRGLRYIFQSRERSVSSKVFDEAKLPQAIGPRKMGRKRKVREEKVDE
jgi:hypothetical protein